MTVYKLRGKHVVDMLKKSTPVDLHDSSSRWVKLFQLYLPRRGL